MTTWTNEELDKIGNADELRIASLRNDGTLRKQVIIWVVRVADDLYVRSVNGRSSGWFRGVQGRYEGRIEAGGVQKDVVFVEETDPEINRQIDAGYRSKYGRYPASYVDPMVLPAAQDTTIKIVPKQAGT